jgi:hypothetical protein
MPNLIGQPANFGHDGVPIATRPELEREIWSAARGSQAWPRLKSNQSERLLPPVSIAAQLNSWTSRRQQAQIAHAG